MISIVTASITSLWSLLLQHLLRHYDLYCYSIYYVTMPWLLQHLLRLYDLSCYNIYYVTMISIATAPNTSQYIIKYYRPHGLTNNVIQWTTIYPWLRPTPDTTQATAGTHWMREPGSGRRDALPTPMSKTMSFYVIILMSVFECAGTINTYLFHIFI